MAYSSSNILGFESHYLQWVDGCLKSDEAALLDCAQALTGEPALWSNLVVPVAAALLIVGFSGSTEGLPFYLRGVLFRDPFEPVVVANF